MNDDKGAINGLYRLIEKYLSGILINTSRTSKFVSPPDDALIAYPATTVTIATPTRPDSPDEIASAPSGITGYDPIFIFYDGQRISNETWVINDGPDSLFVISTFNKIKWSGEDELKPGETRRFTSVRELRVRSPTAGNTYRVTEYKPTICCNNVLPAPLTMVPLQQLTVAPRVITTSASPAINPLKTSNIDNLSVMIHMGRVTATAFPAGINFRIEASALTSGNGQWYPITVFTSALGSGVQSLPVTGTSPAGQNVILMNNTGTLAAGNIVFILNPTFGNSEFARISAVSANVSITLEDPLNFDQSSSTVTNQAEMYYALIDTSSIPRLRVVVDGSQPGGVAQNFVAEVRAVTG